eukprot:8983120-Karenia_brevis.AAC.1
MEDPLNEVWGKLVEPTIAPKGDHGQPLFNHIYTDHVCPPKDPPPGEFVDRLWGRNLVNKGEAKVRPAQRAGNDGPPGGTASTRQPKPPPPAAETAQGTPAQGGRGTRDANMGDTSGNASDRTPPKASGQGQDSTRGIPSSMDTTGRGNPNMQQQLPQQHQEQQQQQQAQ